MLRRSRAGFDEAADDPVALMRKQDANFCRRLLFAISAGRESCPVGVNTQPGTKKPIFNYQRPDRLLN
jgi:hypothetical protein